MKYKLNCALRSNVDSGLAEVALSSPIDFQGIDHWLFDLDNTLYSENSGLFREILNRMTHYVAKVKNLDLGTAQIVQERLFRHYGTTLKGLMVEDNIDPAHYSSMVHDVDLSELQPDPVMVDFFKHCAGQRIIFTNGTLFHAERILDALGLGRHIDGVHDIAATDYCPKPDAQAYQSVIDRFSVDPHRAIFFEDSWANLQAAKPWGFKTVFLRYGRQMPSTFDEKGPDWVLETIDPALALMREHVKNPVSG